MERKKVTSQFMGSAPHGLCRLGGGVSDAPQSDTAVDFQCSQGTGLAGAGSGSVVLATLNVITQFNKSG